MNWIVWSGTLFLGMPLVCFSFPPQYTKDEALKKGEYHQALEELDRSIASANEQKLSLLLLEKAKLLCLDQKISEAQEVFLKALETCATEKGVVSPEEEKVTQSLIPLYLAASSSQEKMTQVEQDVNKILKQHPEYISIKYFLAAVSANKNDFLSFFDQLYQAHRLRPDCYLALKMQGVLHLRLFEASSEENVRQYHKDQAFSFLQKAFAKEPQDASLIAKLLFLLPLDERKKFLENVFQDISGMKIPLQRSECIYLIKEAIESKSIGVAKKLIEKANLWYEYSRAIQELSKQIDLVEKQEDMPK